jgi:ComF family protein
VCDACVEQFAQPQPRCTTCALPVPAGIRQCIACVRRPPVVDACIAAVPYAYPWSQLVAEFKFREQAGWARNLALLMRSTPWVEPALEAADLLLPMPLAEARLRERGFNQALLLCRQLAPSKTQARLLLRLRDTVPQATLSRSARQHNLHDAFAVEPLEADRVRGRRVVLVDDVMTSGASLHHAATALRAAGASHLTALVLARAELPPADD